MLVQRNDDGFWCSSYGLLVDDASWMVSNGFEPVDAERIAKIRLSVGQHRHESWTGTLLTQHLGFDGERVWLLNEGPTWECPVEAAWFSYNKQETPWDTDVSDAATEMDLGVLEDGVLETKSLPFHPLGKALFGETVEDYSEWLLDAGIELFPVALPSVTLRREAEPFQRPLILRCLDNWSGVITSDVDLHKPYGHRGWSEGWSGANVEVDETWSRDEIVGIMELNNLGIASLLDLPDEITLGALNSAFSEANVSEVLPSVLRLLRTGTLLPVNYESWQNGTH